MPPQRLTVLKHVTEEVSYTSGVPISKVDETDQLKLHLDMQKQDLIKLTQLLRAYMRETVPAATLIKYADVSKAKQTVGAITDLVHLRFSDA